MLVLVQNQKEHNACEKDIWNPATCSCENDEYLTNTMNI